MSRSGYSDDCDFETWDWIRWRGAVESSIRGKRGQAFLCEMVAALDALPERRLVEGELQTPDGSVCALGAVAKARGIDTVPIDPEDSNAVAATFGIANAMACEIVYANDEVERRATPEQRFDRMLRWAKAHLRDQAESKP